jgi:hypothetical protein
MDDQRTNREGGDLRANVWLNSIIILAFTLAAFYHFVHVWDGGSPYAAALAILDIACMYVLSLNITRRKEN